MRRLWLAALTLACLPALALAQSSAGGGGSGGGSGGSVSVSNFPATQPVSGTVAATQSGAWNTGISGTLPAFAATPTFNLGTLNGAALDTSVQAVKTALGSPFQAGGSIGNAAFGISGTLPAFAATPTFNLGTLNGAALDTSVQAVKTALGSPFQAGGSIGNAAFGISGTLPAFAATPTFNIGTTNGLLLNTTLTDRLNILGQKAMSGSAPVVIASDQTVPVAAYETGTTLAAAAISPVASNGVSSFVVKNTAGNLYGAYALNQTATAGFLVLIDAASVPASGASVGATECVPLPANGSAVVNYGAGPPERYFSGIVLLISTSCATYTPGSLVGYLKPRVR